MINLKCVGLICWVCATALQWPEIGYADGAATEAVAPAVEEFVDFSEIDLESLLNIEIELGSGFKQKLAEIPAIVEVMDRAEIDRLGIRDVRELLIYLTGAYETGTQIAPVLSPQISIRGGPAANRIMILVDDHNMLDGADENYEGNSIPWEAVERVEYLRGPAAILYGSSAMAGVVRIVLRRPDKSGGGGYIAGDPVGKGADLNVFGAVKLEEHQLSFRADVQVRQTEARRYSSNIGGGTFVSGSFSQQVTSVSSILSTYWRDLFFRFRQHYVQANMVGLEAKYLADAGPSEKNLYGFELGYRRALASEWHLDLNGSFDLRRRELDTGAFPSSQLLGLPAQPTIADQKTDVILDGTIMGVDTKVRYGGEKVNLNMGLNYRNIKSSKLGFRFKNTGLPHPLSPAADFGAQLHQLDMIVDGGYQLLDNLDLLGGFRLNFYKPVAENSGLAIAEESPAPTISPMARAAIVWRILDELSLKLLYGRAFRLPTTQELFLNIVGVVNSNPTLEPEVQDTVEIAIDLRPADQLSIRINAFLNLVHNTIDFVVFDPTTSNAGQYQNIPNSQVLKVLGAETVVRWLPFVWWDLNGSFTYHEGKQEDGTYMSDLPRTLAKGWMTFMPLKDNRLEITPSIVHRGNMGQIESENILSAGANYRPLDWMTVSLHAINPLNHAHGVEAFPVPGVGERRQYLEDSRAIRLGLRAEF